MKNYQLVQNIIDQLFNLNVTEVCVCPGGRNAPFVDALSQKSCFFKVHSFFEERAASFFALGRIKAEHKPVAVITTSGTAASELFSAVIEGFYSGLPLIVITADRPKKYRGTGSPQSIDQAHLFGSYVSHFYDLSVEEPVPTIEFPDQFPIHLNVCFDEPLLDGNVLFNLTRPTLCSSKKYEVQQKQLSQVDQFLSNKKKPLVIVSHLEEAQQPKVAEFLYQLRAPIYAESSSGLKNYRELEALMIQSGDSILKKINWDGVLRIGGVPTTRLWRDLEFHLEHLDVLSISELKFSGLTHGNLIQTDLIDFWKSLDTKPIWNIGELEEFISYDREQYHRLSELALSEPNSEPSLIRSLSRLIKTEDRLFLGNSMPIRQWDLMALHQPVKIGTNRGANGIDGQLSCFIGFSDEQSENWGLFGDLTTLYDLVAPWALKNISPRSLKFVVINNSGGRIFSRMFQSELFLNVHQVNFKPWANFWNLDYFHWSFIPQDFVHKNSAIIEIEPDIKATQRFWQGYEKIWKTS